jgi:hypothetical protein
MFQIGGWLGGDVLKIAYFLSRQVPAVFFYGAFVQAALDLSIALQLFVFYPNDDTRALLQRLPFGRWLARRRGKGGDKHEPEDQE